jgi:hypothetical protein
MAPAKMHTEETHSTLKFALRATKVENKAVMNEVLDDQAMLKRYRKTIKELQCKLGAFSHRPDSKKLEEEKQKVCFTFHQMFGQNNMLNMYMNNHHSFAYRWKRTEKKWKKSVKNTRRKSKRLRKCFFVVMGRRRRKSQSTALYVSHTPLIFCVDSRTRLLKQFHFYHRFGERLGVLLPKWYVLFCNIWHVFVKTSCIHLVLSSFCSIWCHVCVPGENSQRFCLQVVLLSTARGKRQQQAL